MIKYYPEKLSLNISQSVCFIVSFLLLLSCLLNFEVFLYSSLFNYFVFVFGSCGILIITFLSEYRFIKKTEKITITLPFILFLFWMLFVFFEQGESIQYRTYKTSSCYLFIASFIILQKYKAVIFYKAISFTAVIEGLWCILQYFGKIPSENVNFKVTGSFSNPNVVAMFMALCIPTLLYFCLKSATPYIRTIYYLMLLIVCIGFLLLECRTAILGTILSSGLFIILHFNIINRYKKKYLLLGILAVTILSVPIGRQLYLHKKDSADGRLLIWRISSQMVLDSPLRGYGTGMFEKEYNLRQAKEIQQEKLSQSELNNASFVLMAYNDYLEQAIEGGFPAVLLFIIMLISFLYLYPKKTKIFENNINNDIDICYVAYAGFASFAFMAFINFTLNAIPVMFLFCFYAAVLCANNNNQKKYHFSITPQTNRILFSLVICSVFYVFYSQIILVKENYQLKNAHDLLEEKNIVEAEKLLLPLIKSQQNSVNFCITYGSLLYIQNRYKESLIQFNCAKWISSNPELYDLAAKCEFNLKNKEGTIANLYQAAELSPKTMRYKFGLMQLLFTSNRIKEAGEIAQKIVSMVPKNPDEQTDKYQRKAQQLLEYCQSAKN